MICYRLKPDTTLPLTPVAVVIENCSDFKGLLSEGIDPEEGSLPRQWSLWKTIDPVSLLSGKVQPGLPEFACHFANNVFVFASEDNLKAFISNPRRYLQTAPEMPKDWRLMITGPSGSGAHT